MTTNKMLLLGIPVGLFLAGLALLIPLPAAFWYIMVAQPALLLLGSVLALWVAPMYRGDMKNVFLFLSAFLLFYGVVNITPLADSAADALGGQFFKALLAYQIITYSFLLASCAFILRVTEIKSLNSWGKAGVCAAIGLAIVITVAAIPTFREVLEFSAEAAFLYLVIRIFDALVMVMIVPVILLYVQNMRAQYQESISFVVISAGVVASLILAYLYEIAKWESLADIAVAEFQSGSMLDALYLFGYFIIPLGLLAHRKHQDWSLKQVQRLLM